MIGDQVLLNSQEIAKILSGKTDINTVEFSTPNESEVKKMSSYLKGYMEIVLGIWMKESMFFI